MVSLPSENYQAAFVTSTKPADILVRDLTRYALPSLFKGFSTRQRTSALCWRQYLQPIHLLDQGHLDYSPEIIAQK